MRHPKSLAVSYKLLIINNSIFISTKSDEVGKKLCFCLSFPQFAVTFGTPPEDGRHSGMQTKNCAFCLSFPSFALSLGRCPKMGGTQEC